MTNLVSLIVKKRVLRNSYAQIAAVEDSLAMTHAQSSKL